MAKPTRRSASKRVSKALTVIRGRARKQAKKTTKLDNEFAKLKSDLRALSKKKTSRKQLSEYNLFMRRQLKAGKSFSQGVRLWKAYRKGKPLTRIKRVVKTRVVVRRVKARAKPKRAVRRKARKAVRNRVPKIRSFRLKALQPRAPRAKAERAPQVVHRLHQLSQEQVAIELVKLYFEEVAHVGFKRTLDLDQILDAYHYALEKLKSRKPAAVEKPSNLTELESLVNQP